MWPRCHLPSCQSLPGPHIPVWRFLFQLSKLSETCPRIRQISWSIDIPIVIDAAFKHDIQIRSRSSGDINVFQWNREWFFSRRVKLWIWVQRDGGKWSFLTWTKNHLLLHRPSGSESWGGEGGDPSDSPRKSLWLSPRIGCSRIKMVFSVPDLLQKVWFVHLRLEIWIFHFLWASIVSNSSRSAISTSPFQILHAYKAYPRNNPGKTFFPNWWMRDWSFAVIGWYSTNETNGIIGPLNGCPKRLSYAVFPSDKRSWAFRR